MNKMRSLTKTLKSLKKKILSLKNTMNEMKIAIQREHQQQNGSSKKKNL